jgi:hypothetical protein
MAWDASQEPRVPSFVCEILAYIINHLFLTPLHNDKQQQTASTIVNEGFFLPLSF